MDLINELIRETYRPDCLLPNPDVRQDLLEAKRFILDADMSEMLGNMSVAPYNETKAKDRGALMTSQRRGAKLPFDKMFVQYDGLAFRRGILASGAIGDAWGNALTPVETANIIDPVGWLMTQSGSVVCVSEMFVQEKRGAALPFAWMYTTDDSTLENETINEVAILREAGLLKSEFAERAERVNGDNADYFDVQAGQIAHGLTGHHDPSQAILYMNWKGKRGIRRDELVDVQGPDGKTLFSTHYLVAECGGATRYVFAFLNMLNSVPVRYERARRVEGYLANGKRRAAVQSDVIRLILPNRTITYRDYARQLTQGILTRAAHPVRGHWRVYGPHHCGDHSEHEWGPTDETQHADCVRDGCKASRTWIKNYHTKNKEEREAMPRTYSVGAR